MLDFAFDPSKKCWHLYRHQHRVCPLCKSIALNTGSVPCVNEGTDPEHEHFIRRLSEEISTSKHRPCCKMQRSIMLNQVFLQIFELLSKKVRRKFLGKFA